MLQPLDSMQPLKLAEMSQDFTPVDTCFLCDLRGSARFAIQCRFVDSAKTVVRRERVFQPIDISHP